MLSSLFYSLFLKYYRSIFPTLIFLIIIILSVLSVTKIRHNTPNITFIDVGNSDSILVTYGSAKLLIDGGPDKSSPVYLSYFNFLNFCSFDAVFLTHSHADHLAGLLPVLKSCSVKNFLVNNLLYKSKFVDELNVVLEKRYENLIVSNLYRGEFLKIGDLYLYVLWPPRNFSDENINNESIVLLLDYYDFEVLFLADAEFSVQQNFLKDPILKKIDLPLEIIKVPHQGSIDSLNKKLLEYLKPRFAVFSVGPNSYGHPDENVIKFYENLGTQVLRTDYLGNIVIKVQETPSEQ